MACDLNVWVDKFEICIEIPLLYCFIHYICVSNIIQHKIVCVKATGQINIICLWIWESYVFWCLESCAMDMGIIGRKACPGCNLFMEWHCVSGLQVCNIHNRGEEHVIAVVTLVFWMVLGQQK